MQNWVQLQISNWYTCDLVDQSIMATCLANHSLLRKTRTQLIEEDINYAETFVCQICKCRPKFKNYLVYHCSKCRYDLCYKCYGKGRFRIHAVKEELLSNQKRFRLLQMCESLQS